MLMVLVQPMAAVQTPSWPLGELERPQHGGVKHCMSSGGPNPHPNPHSNNNSNNNSNKNSNKNTYRYPNADADTFVW